MLLREQLASDAHRPRYHFLPPSNWMNDPNGVIQWQGEYHLFYQYNPTGPLWGNMHWGHATSADLIHWADKPIALAPTPGGPDASGCFSGCAVNHAGVPTLVYTATAGQHHEIQTQCLATSGDGLQTWVKNPRNPVLSAVPAQARQTKDFRDPFVWQEGDVWYMAVGSGIRDVGGVVFLYRSANLLDWEYLHPLLASDDQRLGAIWECPNFFRLGEQWVLIISAHTGTRTDTVHYFVGEYRNQQFTPVTTGVLDCGCLYAPLSFADDQGRRVLFGWLREERSEAALQRAGWAGVQAIPRVLSLDAHGRLLMEPVPELERIRGRHHHAAKTGRLDQPVTLAADTLALDIAVAFEPGIRAAGRLELAYGGLPEETLQIAYDAHSQRIAIHKAGASQDVAGKARLEAPHPLAADEALQLRILLDGSVVEVIANGRTSMSTRFYPTAASGVEIRLAGDGADLRSLDAWEMPATFSAAPSENLAAVERGFTAKS